MHQKAILAGAGVLVVVFLAWLWATEGASPVLARVQAAAPRADRTPAGGPGSDLVSPPRGRTAAAQNPQGERPEPTARSRGAQLTVKVIDAGTRRPLEGVRLVAYESGVARSTREIPGADGDLSFSPRSDGDGEARFALPVGRPLRLAVDGRAPIRVQPLVAGEERQLVVPVTRAPLAPADRSLDGLVLDLDTGAPVPAAELRLRALDGTAAWTRVDGPAATTDALGRFELSPAPGEPVGLQVDAPGYGAAAWLLEPNAPRAERTLRLSRAASLEVRVLGGEEGVQRAVRLSCSLGELSRDPDTPAGLERRWDGEVQADRVALLEDLPAGVLLRLELLEDGLPQARQARSLRLTAGESTTLELDLDPGAVISGSLRTPAGTPVAYQELWLVPADSPAPMNLATHRARERLHARATTDPQGAFRFEAVPAGEWALGPAPPAAPRTEGWAPRGRWFRTPRGTRALSLELTAQAGRYIEGQVLQEDGSPAAHATLLHRALAEAGGMQAEADAEGRFRLGPLGPGPYEVTAMEDRAAGHAGSTPALVTDTEEPLQLVVRAGTTLRVSGYREADGRRLPLTRAFVTRSDASATLATTHRASHGETTLALGPIQAAQVSIAVVTPGGLCGVVHGVDVDSSQEGQQLVPLRPGAALELSNRGEGAHSVEVRLGGAVVEQAQLAAGDVRRLTVPAGRLEVSITDEAGAIERRIVRLASGEAAAVQLPR